MKRRIAFFLFCFLISGFCFPASGYAACTSPAGANGELMYNGDAHIPQYCNGVSWVVMAPTINLPTTNGLVGYWKLDDGSGTSATDSSGSGSSGDTAPQNHLLVTSLKMVRDNCKQQP